MRRVFVDLIERVIKIRESHPEHDIYFYKIDEPVIKVEGGVYNETEGWYGIPKKEVK